MFLIFNSFAIMEKKTQTKEGNQYDKIVKENIEAVVPAILDKVLGIRVLESIELSADLQRTKELKADVLRKITESSENTFILHLEFQAADDPEMHYRMQEYYGMIKRKYKLPIKQCVVYIGAKQTKMLTKLDEDSNHFEYLLIEVNKINYQKFLNSSRPEEILFSVLSDFGNEKPEKAVFDILNRVEETSKSENTFKRHFQQLRTLARLRNIEPLIDQVMDSVANYMKDENDILFIVGKKQEQEKFVRYLLQQTDFDMSKISNIVGVSLDFVKRIKQKLSNN